MQRDIGLAEEPSHMDYAGEQSGSDDLSGDFLHDGRTVGVPGDEIATTVSAWLAELGTHSPLVEDVARAARPGDWPAAYAISEHLSCTYPST